MGNTDTPGGLSLYSNDYMFERKASEFKPTVYIFYLLQWNIFKLYLYHTSIFIFFHLIPLLIFFFRIEKEDKLWSFFYIKRTQIGFWRTITPALSIFLSRVMCSSKSFLFLWVLMLFLFTISFNWHCLFSCVMSLK